MNDIEDDNAAPPRHEPNRKMTREEVVKAVTEGHEEVKKKKQVMISSGDGETINVDAIAQGMDVAPDSTRYHILKAFCEGKNATLTDIKALIQRMEDMSTEQLNVLKVICQKGKGFAARTILKAVPPIRKFGKEKLLILRAFVDLDGLAPGPLGRFYATALPQGGPGELGREGYEKELKEKMIRPDQATLFYNICYGIKDTIHTTAIQCLPKVRMLPAQHTLLMNTFLKESSVFGKKPINNDTILGLINLFLTLSELQDVKRCQKMIKKLSKQPDEKKNDFQFIVHTFKTEIESEKGGVGGGLTAGIRNFFS